jgi:hypothetical protein
MIEAAPKGRNIAILPLGVFFGLVRDLTAELEDVRKGNRFFSPAIASVMISTFVALSWRTPSRSAAYPV